MYHFLRILTFVTVLLTVPATADEWPESLKTALAVPNEEVTYSYVLTMEGSGEFTDFFIEALVDPTRPPEQRIKILSSSGSETDDFAAWMQLVIDRPPEDIWCSSVSKGIPKDVALVDETADTLVFSYRPKS